MSWHKPKSHHFSDKDATELLNFAPEPAAAVPGYGSQNAEMQPDNTAEGPLRPCEASDQLFAAQFGVSILDMQHWQGTLRGTSASSKA